MNDKLATQEQVKRPPTFVQRVESQTCEIVGFTEENKRRIRFPREGKIHLGEKKKAASGAEYPVATDHFVLPDQLLADGLFAETLQEVGENPQAPQKLPIWFPSDAIADNIDTSFNRYNAKRILVCGSSDGKTAHCLDETTGEYVEQPCANKECPFFQSQACQIIHRIRVMLPDASGVGVWQIDTKSPNNWAALTSEMTTIKAMTGGKLAGVDLVLTLELTEKTYVEKKKGVVQTDAGGKAKMGSTKVWLLHVRSPFRLRELRKAAAVAQADWDMSEVETVDYSYDGVVSDPQPEDVDQSGSDFPVGEPTPEPEPVEAEVVGNDDPLPEPPPDEPQGKLIDTPVAGPPPCSKCGEIIGGGTLGGEKYTASQIVDLTVEKTGKALCIHDFCAWKTEQRKKEAKKS